MTLLPRFAFAALRAYRRIAPTERGGYRLVRGARRLLPISQWRGDYTTPDGFSLSLDLGTYPDCCMAVGLYELDTDRQIRRLLRPGGWFVDCGANIGYFTLLAARQVGPTGRVDAFEPDPVNVARLHDHLRRNHLDSRVRVHAMALSSQPGTLRLFHPPDGGRGNHGMASIYASLVPGGQCYDIPAVRLDQQLDGVPDLIKMDIEGAELAAIGGMTNLLASPHPPSLIVEHNPTSCAAAGYKPGDLYRALLAAQPAYKAFWIGWRLHRLSSPDHIDHLPRQGNLLYQK